MRFQPGQSGNPAGRPPGAPNKATLAVEDAMAERAQEFVDSMMDRAKQGDPAAMRLALERLAPTGRNRRVAIDLPVIKTPEDAELALSVVTDELAAGNLTISDASALINLIDRMLRVAERMWNFARACQDAAKRDAIALAGEEPSEVAASSDPKTPETPEKAAASLYSPVNSRLEAGGEGAVGGSRLETQPARPDTAPPLARAA